MEFLQGKTAFFRFDIWVNKSLSIRGIKVFFDDFWKEECDYEISVWAAFHTREEVMEHFFPWLAYVSVEYLGEDEQNGEIESHVFEVKLYEAAKHYLALEEFYASEDVPEEPELSLDDDEIPKDGESDFSGDDFA